VCAKLGLDLSRTGSGLLVGYCPFHDEKVPSFTVYPHNNSWFSFCCGQGGGSLHLIAAVEDRPLAQVAEDYAGDLPVELARKALAEMGKTPENLEAKRYAARAVVRDCMRSVAAAIRELEDAHAALDACQTEEDLDRETVRILCGLSGRKSVR